MTEGIVMPLNARIAHNSLAGAIVACAAILAAGCGSHSSAGSQPASSPSGSQSGAASASATASASAAQATSQAPTAPASGTAASAPSCSTSSLHITLANGGAGAGTDFTVLEFTNGGSSACTIYGFPGVSLTNSAGAQIGAAATRNPSRASALITLAPGAQANATLGVANAENYPATACKPTTAAKLKVYPPNQTQSAELPFTVTGCAVSATHQLSVTAVTVGAGQTVP